MINDINDQHSMVKMFNKNRVKGIICRKLHLDILFEPMLFIFEKNVCTSSGSISGTKCGFDGQYSRLQGQYFEVYDQYSSPLAPGVVPKQKILQVQLLIA